MAQMKLYNAKTPINKISKSVVFVMNPRNPNVINATGREVAFRTPEKKFK